VLMLTVSRIRFLSQFARHYRTRQPLPEEMIRGLRASKTEFMGVDTQIQVRRARPASSGIGGSGHGPGSTWSRRALPGRQSQVLIYIPFWVIMQVLYALVDQRLFGPHPLAMDPLSSEFLASVQREVSTGLRAAPGTITWEGTLVSTCRHLAGG
jgi:hypothetical protein